MKNKLQTGFTLIELIIVIVILGILAVTAAPRFIDLSSDAKKANHSAFLGVIKTAMKLAHMKCIVDTNCSVSGESSTTVNGTVIAMRNGYPAPNNGIVLVLNYGDWVPLEGHENLGTIFSHPGTTWNSSDCTIYYHHRITFSEPTFNSPYTRSTCS